MATPRENASIEIARFLHDREPEILDLWQALTEKSVPSASRIPREQWRDHVPELLQFLRSLAKQMAAGAPLREADESAPGSHALTRLAQGLKLAEGLDELLLLRRAITRLWRETHREATMFEAADALELLLDYLIRDAAHRFANARERVLHALDRVAQVGLEGGDHHEGVLQRLVEVIVEEVPDADTVGLLIRQGETLHLRAAVGLEQPRAEQAFSVKIGEGFAGRVAATARPVLWHERDIASGLKSTELRSLGLRVLFGVPTPHVGDVLGVLHVGSRVVEEFNPLALQVFRAVSDRVGTVVARQQRSASQQGVIRMVSHDLQTPLSAIILQADMLQRQAAEPEARRRGQIIGRSARSIEVLVKDLVDTARSEEGQLVLNPGPVQLRPFVEGLCERFSGVLPTERIETHVPDWLPGVWADADRLERILLNVLGNALKYSAPSTPVSLECVPAGDGVLIAVTDFGVGIVPEALPFIFDRDYRAPQAQGTDGFGLGLAITRMLVKAHGGSITVESETGKGSTFRIWLPSAASTSDRPSPPP